MSDVSFDDLETAYPLSLRDEFWAKLLIALQFVFDLDRERALALLAIYRQDVESARSAEQVLTYREPPVHVAADLHADQRLTADQYARYDEVTANAHLVGEALREVRALSTASAAITQPTKVA